MIAWIASFRIDPMGAVRLTQHDHWKPRAQRYFAYKDRLRELADLNFVLPEHYHLVFHLPMPPSWSAKKRDKMRGQPHRQKPDKDNLEKGFLDALYGDDSAVYDGRVSKFWADEGEIDVYEIDPPNYLII